MKTGDFPPIARPSDTTWKYLRYLLGFGVWFAIGLAPLLGNQKIPLFSALIDLYPAGMQKTLIPLSGLLMGMMAVIVEFASGRRLKDANVSRWFVRTSVVFLIAFCALIVVYRRAVVHIAVPDGRLAFVTGTLEVPASKSPRCECVVGTSARECVREGTTEAAIDACFGATRVANAELVLQFLYLIVTGGFAAAVGLLLLSQRKAPS